MVGIAQTGSGKTLAVSMLLELNSLTLSFHIPFKLTTVINMGVFLE
jgi:hypothetical protein